MASELAEKLGCSHEEARLPDLCSLEAAPASALNAFEVARCMAVESAPWPPQYGPLPAVGVGLGFPGPRLCLHSIRRAVVEKGVARRLMFPPSKPPFHSSTSQRFPTGFAQHSSRASLGVDGTCDCGSLYLCPVPRLAPASRSWTTKCGAGFSPSGCSPVPI